MKSIPEEKQKLNLINCERIESETLHNTSSQIRCTIPVKVNFPKKTLQISNIHQTESVVRIKQAE